MQTQIELKIESPKLRECKGDLKIDKLDFEGAKNTNDEVTKENPVNVLGVGLNLKVMDIEKGDNKEKNFEKPEEPKETPRNHKEREMTSLAVFV